MQLLEKNICLVAIIFFNFLFNKLKLREVFNSNQILAIVINERFFYGGFICSTHIPIKFNGGAENQQRIFPIITTKEEKLSTLNCLVHSNLTKQTRKSLATCHLHN